MTHTPFLDVAIIISVVVLLVLVMRRLRQPPIISYILAGIVLSPYGLNVVRADAGLEIFSQMGVSFLLFMVGLSLNPKIVREVGKVAAVTGIGQVIFASLIGYVLAVFLGFSPLTSLYLAVALSFSSTIIIMKLLSDKGDTESLYGRIATGFLIVQDLLAMILLIGITSLSGGGALPQTIAFAVLRIAGLIVLLVPVGGYILPRLLRSVASSQELLLLFAIGWCMAVAAFCQIMGLSIEIGALAAGVVLSLSPYRFEVAAKLRPLRDFFIVLFFVLLGSQMAFDGFRAHLPAILAFTGFVLIGNPLVVLVLMGCLGYGKRNSFRAGLTVAQVSEFSFILIALGIRVGHLSPEILSFVTFVGLLTIAGSTYFMLYADALYRLLERPLSYFERRGPKADDHAASHADAYDILLLGYERIGLNVLHALQRSGKSFLVVDYNPETIRQLSAQGINSTYGDLGDSELLDNLNFSAAKMIVSTIRDFDTTMLLLRRARAANPDAIIIALSQQVDQALYLYEQGASYVITPQFLSGYHTSMLIEEYGLDLQKFLTEKAKHIAHLERAKPCRE